MPQLFEKSFFWRIILLLCLATGCQAQTEHLVQTADQAPKVVETPVVEQKVADADKKKPVGECDFSSLNTLKEMPGEFIRLPNPGYPKKAGKIFGDVSVRVLLNKSGEVEQVCK